MTDTPLFDPRPCRLGEGPLWHPERGQLFWFDILGRRLLTRSGEETDEWSFERHVSAAGWTGANTLLIANETALCHFDLTRGTSEEIAALEADNPVTRSNDGRADPWGGFWIGTMGKQAEREAGAIYRYYRGELRRVFDRITISNAICFSPDGNWLYFADTRRRKVWRQALRDSDGWPAESDPELFLDLTSEELNPDGAVVDSAGHIWIAQWGASRVARYTPEGRLERSIGFPAQQISCPAFGGPSLATIFATSASDGLSEDGIHEGCTFSADLSADGITGQAEHRVLL